MSKPILQVITVSTRPGRIGPTVAAWAVEAAGQHDGFEVEAVNLADFALPIFDEPNHPLMQNYQHDHTKKWAESVARADAFLLVIPEYDYFTPAPLVNAIQYLAKEWFYKPVGFVGYTTGISGGLRAIEATKPLLTSVKMMPMTETVAISFLRNQLDENGQFQANEIQQQSLHKNLDELLRWTVALKSLRG